MKSNYYLCIPILLWLYYNTYVSTFLLIPYRLPISLMMDFYKPHLFVLAIGSRKTFALYGIVNVQEVFRHFGQVYKGINNDLERIQTAEDEWVRGKRRKRNIPPKHMANFVVHPINCRFSEFVTAKVYKIREMMRDTEISREDKMLRISTAYAGLFNQISVLLLSNK